MKHPKFLIVKNLSSKVTVGFTHVANQMKSNTNMNKNILSENLSKFKKFIQPISKKWIFKVKISYLLSHRFSGILWSCPYHFRSFVSKVSNMVPWTSIFLRIVTFLMCRISLTLPLIVWYVSKTVNSSVYSAHRRNLIIINH